MFSIAVLSVVAAGGAWTRISTIDHSIANWGFWGVSQVVKQ